MTRSSASSSGGMDNRVSCLTVTGERLWQVEVPRPVSRVALASRGPRPMVGLAGGRTLLLDDSRVVRSETSVPSLVELRITTNDRYIAVHQRGINEILAKTITPRSTLYELADPIDRILATSVSKDGGTTLLLGTKDGRPPSSTSQRTEPTGHEVRSRGWSAGPCEGGGGGRHVSRR